MQVRACRTWTSTCCSLQFTDPKQQAFLTLKSINQQNSPFTVCETAERTRQVFFVLFFFANLQFGKSSCVCMASAFTVGHSTVKNVCCRWDVMLPSQSRVCRTYRGHDGRVHAVGFCLLLRGCVIREKNDAELLQDDPEEAELQQCAVKQTDTSLNN